MKHSGVDDVVELIQNMRKRALSSKMDIKLAFRLLPSRPSDFELLGFAIEGCMYFDKMLPMGASCSCALFETFSTSLQWAVE